MLEEAASRWHAAVNQRDLAAARAAVTDPVDVSGPRGTGPIPADAFVEWIIDSGIALHPVSWHPVGDDTIVVEQDASWPDPTATETGRTAPTRVATLFRVRDGAVALAHRHVDLHTALRAATDLTS
ncbi:nuclear transport factor 2 family protein [Plantactinospora sp. WMMB782]|uniref:nuclear transport factor 2 family protein n=1 Tax=Plantactinospora sp. WMMB782 TaxID=3404121 RepID=UPI003B92ABF6